jgi:iron complex outermembrane recepter protein
LCLFALLEDRIAIGATDIFDRQASLSYTGIFSITGSLGPTNTDGFGQYPYNSLRDMRRAVYIR